MFEHEEWIAGKIKIEKKRRRKCSSCMLVPIYCYDIYEKYMAIFFWSKMKVTSCPGSLCYRDMYEENKSNNLQLPATFLYEVQGRMM